MSASRAGERSIIGVGVPMLPERYLHEPFELCGAPCRGVLVASALARSIADPAQFSIGHRNRLHGFVGRLG
jgi:hypothetical protein